MPSSHFAPHAGVSFEGYYSKFRLESGSSIALIVSAVPAATKHAKRNKAFMISFTYVLADSTKHVQMEYWPAAFDIDRRNGFVIKWDQGEFGWDEGAERCWWEMRTDDLYFSACTRAGSRVAYSPGQPGSTPAGWLANLPLPIQWHVHSLDSECQYKLDLHDSEFSEFPSSDQSGQAGRVHTEKNWALSFPDSYIWVQARDHERGQGVCLAGGSLIPGVQAYLVGYDHPTHPLSFAPPSSTSIFALSLGLQSNISYQDRQVMIEINGWFERIRITALAPADTFFTLSAPLNTGHAPDYATQSYGATIRVETWRRSWPWMVWTSTSMEEYERGSLEFGGGFYRKHTD